MKLPIIISEHGDVSVFNTIEAAEQYLEAIDVKNNEYIAYDANGKLLNLKIVLKGKQQIEHVQVCENNNDMEEPETLRTILLNLLLQFGVPIPEESPLDKIIEKTIDRIGYTS